MKPSTKLALAQLFAAAGAVLTALGEEFGGESNTTTAATPEAPKRGRKPAVAASAEPAASTPAEPVTNDTPTGKTYDELKAIIKPLVEAGRGEEVKKVIAKYSVSLKVMADEPQHHAAFEKDIAELAKNDPESY